MKVCVLNFSGNVGKSTIAAHLLQPRLNAQVFSVESLNVDASSDGVEVARLRGKHYNDLLQRLAGDTAFAGIDLTAALDPQRYVGRAPEQVDAFVRECVEPLLARYAHELAEDDADVRV